MKTMDFETFAALHGAAFDFGDAGMHSPRGNASRAAWNRMLKLIAARNADLQARRDALRVAYRVACETGDIRPPTRNEVLRSTAMGNGENESVQAARRLLIRKSMRSLSTAENMCCCRVDITADQV